MSGAADKQEEEVFATPEADAPRGLIAVRGGGPGGPQAAPPSYDDGSGVVEGALSPAGAFEVFAGKAYEAKAPRSASGVSVGAISGKQAPMQDPISRCTVDNK